MLSHNLGLLGISKLNVVSISSNGTLSEFIIRNPSLLVYTQLDNEGFKELVGLEDKPELFLEYNKTTIYIYRNGTFLDIKNLILNVENHHVKVGMSKSQKSHVLSPIELRFNTYLLAMFNFKYINLIEFSDFNNLPKSKYLPSKKFDFI